MSARDFTLLALVCLIWGANLPMTRWIASDVPPLFIATLRFAGTLLLLAPYLRRRPRNPALLAAVGLLTGGLQFALQFVGVAQAPASAAAIAAQLGIPFAATLSVLLLGERINGRRLLGMVTALTGVVCVVYDPARFGISTGLAFVIASAFSLALGTVLMKRMQPMTVLELQAWTAVVSVVPLALASAVFEHGQWQGLVSAGPAKWAGIAYSVLFASIAGQAIYYALVRRNDVSLLTPLTLMTPIWSVLISNLALGEPLTPRLLLGAGVTITGVALVARGSRSLPRPAQPQLGEAGVG